MEKNEKTLTTQNCIYSYLYTLYKLFTLRTKLLTTITYYITREIRIKSLTQYLCIPPSSPPHSIIYHYQSTDIDGASSLNPRGYPVQLLLFQTRRYMDGKIPLSSLFRLLKCGFISINRTVQLELM